MEILARSIVMNWISPSLKAAVLLVAGLVIPAVAAVTFTQAGSPLGQRYASNTWSIVAADPISGDVGLAVASCVPDFHADVVAALVPGLGAAATQAEFDLANRDRVYESLLAGQPAAAIIDQVGDAAFDARAGSRQYGLVTIQDGRAQTAAFTGSDTFPYAGDRQAPAAGVTVQGNFLAGEAVVDAALAAFLEDDPAGYNALPDRLLRALEAGSAAGGDARCNNDQVKQTAATAAILVARGGDDPYAIGTVGATEAGTPAAPWLALSVTGPRFGPNPIPELRRQYDAWRLENLGLPGEGGPDGLLSPPVMIAALVAVVVVALAGLKVVRRRLQ
jgi:uncharacterized Ntn-hydrolase superfamily protein